MILNQSSTGFLSVSGALPMQFAMLLTFVGTVSIPRDKADEYEPFSFLVYHIVWIMHLASFVTIFFNQYYSECLGVARVTLNTIMMLFKVLVLIYISVEWIFPNKP